MVAIDRWGTRRGLEAARAGTVLNDVGELDLELALGDPWQPIYEGSDAGVKGIPNPYCPGQRLPGRTECITRRRGNFRYPGMWAKAPRWTCATA